MTLTPGISRCCSEMTRATSSGTPVAIVTSSKRAPGSLSIVWLMALVVSPRRDERRATTAGRCVRGRFADSTWTAYVGTLLTSAVPLRS